MSPETEICRLTICCEKYFYLWFMFIALKSSEGPLLSWADTAVSREETSTVIWLWRTDSALYNCSSKVHTYAYSEFQKQRSVLSPVFKQYFLTLSQLLIFSSVFPSDSLGLSIYLPETLGNNPGKGKSLESWTTLTQGSGHDLLLITSAVSEWVRGEQVE